MKTNKRRMPAEWEHQSCVQLTWPHKDTDWADMLPEITAVYEEMAREISQREGLLIVAPKELLSELSARPSGQRPLTSYLLPLTSNDTWAREGLPSDIRHHIARLLLQRLGREVRGYA